MNHLSPELRQEIIQVIAQVIEDNEWLDIYNIVVHGKRGLVDFTDEELLVELKDCHMYMYGEEPIDVEDDHSTLHELYCRAKLAFDIGKALEVQ